MASMNLNHFAIHTSYRLGMHDTPWYFSQNLNLIWMNPRHHFHQSWPSVLQYAKQRFPPEHHWTTGEDDSQVGVVWWWIHSTQYPQHTHTRRHAPRRTHTQNKTGKTADAGTSWPWISKRELSSISLISFWPPVRFTIYRSQTTLALFPPAILSTPSSPTVLPAPLQFVWVRRCKLVTILSLVVDKSQKIFRFFCSALFLEAWSTVEVIVKNIVRYAYTVYYVYILYIE